MKHPDPHCRCPRQLRRGLSSTTSVTVTLLLILVSSCGRVASQVPDSEEPVRVSLGGWGSEEHISPSDAYVGPAGRVEFRVADWRVHVVRFITEGMDSTQIQFLRDHGRLTSPPLVDRGDAFLVDMSGAPLGRYPFVVDGFGRAAYGAVIVGTTVTQ